MIVLVAGVAGSGKSTVGSLLAARLGWTFEDGDALHPAANIAKMRSGEALTDEDRQPWLHSIAAWIDARIDRGVSAVVACSALKRSYRDLLRRGRPGVRVVVLAVGREVLAERLARRSGHFLPASLLDSQLADLELPAPAEPALVVAAEQAPHVIVAQIIDRLGLPATTGTGPEGNAYSGPTSGDRRPG